MAGKKKSASKKTKASPKSDAQTTTRRRTRAKIHHDEEPMNTATSVKRYIGKEMRVSKKAVEELAVLGKDNNNLARRVADSAREIALYAGKKTIQDKAVTSATRILTGQCS